MSPDALRCLRQAGRVAAAARDRGASGIVAGASLRAVCEDVEEAIRRGGGAPAFPTQCSCNAVAAHDCPSPRDGRTFAAGDLAKLDVGVHVDGWVVDTAVTVNVGDRPEGRALVAAAEAALAAALAVAGPRVPVRRLSRAIHEALAAHRVRPMHNLCGHGVGRWAVHGPPPIPNEPDDMGFVLEPGAVVAVEPFATTGSGLVREQGKAEVFRLDPLLERGPTRAPAGVVAAIRAFRGLPFARRHLGGFPEDEVEAALAALVREGRLAGYAPLVETSGSPVAQAEHTLCVHEDGVEVLTASRV